MSKKPKKIKDLIRLEEVGLTLTLRALKDHFKDSSLYVMFFDQSVRIKDRIKQLKKGKNA